MGAQHPGTAASPQLQKAKGIPVNRFLMKCQGMLIKLNKIQDFLQKAQDFKAGGFSQHVTLCLPMRAGHGAPNLIVSMLFNCDYRDLINSMPAPLT